MKIPVPLLWLSVAANLALGAVFLWRNPTGASATPATLAASGATAAPTAVPTAPGVPDAKTWAQLDAASDSEFVGRLRSEGFPPHLLFALVNRRLYERHAAEFKKFQPPVDYEYWRHTPWEDLLSPEDRAARRTLNRQVADERRQLLGDEADLASGYERAMRTRQYGSLPGEKADQLTALNRDYSDVSALLRDRVKGIVLPEDREAFAALERERRADMEKLLSPAELLEYDLRASPSASMVQQKTRNFDLTEEEYRALTHLQLAFDKTYGVTNLSEEQSAHRTEAQAELAAQIKELLPPDRYADYLIKTDPTYSWISGIISRANLPPETTSAVVSAQQDLAQRYNALRNNRTLPAATRDAQLDALSAEANAKLAGLMGPDALGLFKSNGGPINSLLNRRKR